MKYHSRRLTHNIRPLLGTALMLGLLLSGPSRPAFAQTVIAPATNTASEGNLNNGLPLNIQYFGLASERYQQVYNSSDFGVLTGPARITTLSFRPNAAMGAAFSSTLPDIQIDLSTTPAAADGLSATFAGNVGADDTMVYNGALSLSSAFTGPAAGPKDFDIVIQLQTPFLYNPASGNLLLDIRNRGGGSTTFLDAEYLPGDSVSRAGTYTGQTASAPTAGFVDTAGLVTKFQFSPATPNIAPADQVNIAPESSGLANMAGALLALALGGIVMAVKKKRISL